MSAKNELRKSLLQKRLDLSYSVLQRNAKKASENFFALDLYIKSHSLAVYFSYKNELDTQFILEQAQRDNKKIYLPVVQNELLEFYSYELGDPLIDNRFGIPEPNTLHQTKIDPRQLDLIVMPCTACDSKGHRIGSGCGYYDRTLAFKHHESGKQPVLICLAHSLQQLEYIETDDWDVRADIIVTEKKTQTIG